MAATTFTEIFRFHGPTTTKTDGTNVTSAVGATSISVTDTSPPNCKSYYRFEALYVP